MTTDAHGRLYSHHSGFYWLSAVRVTVDAGRPVEVGYRCRIRKLPCWPINCPPEYCGEVIGYGAQRPSGGLAMIAGEMAVNALFPEPVTA